MLDRNLLRQALSSRFIFGLTIGWSLVGGLLTVAQAWYLSRIVDRVFLGGQRLTEVAVDLALLSSVVVLRAVAVAGSTVSAGSLAVRIKTGLRRVLFDHLLALGPGYAQGERAGELAATATDGIEALDAYFRQYLPQLVISVLVPLTILLVVFPLDLTSGLVLLLTAPLIPIFMILIGKAAEALTHRQYDLLGRLSAHFLDVVQGLTTLKALGQSRAQAETIGRVSDQYRVATLSVLRVAFLSALVLEVVATICTAIAAVEVGLRLLYGHIAFQQALFILILAPEFYLPLRTLGAGFHAGASGASAAQRIFEILAIPISPAASPDTARESGPAQREAKALWATVGIRNVRYAYGLDRPALRGVSFELPVGQKVALIGPSGAGKSTIAALLLRFMQPDSGEILIDGRPLEAIPLAEWRTQVAWVSQRPHLFHDTIAANIRLARPDAGISAVIGAARQAYIHDFIETLPEGYETIVGEHGVRLSSGQAQRIALARAFLKDAPLLILDEPTSNLDPELEAWLQLSTDRLIAGRTVLVIAHRLSTVYQADRIVVLNAGRVVEQGRHEELLEQDGLYRRLVATLSLAVVA